MSTNKNKDVAERLFPFSRNFTPTLVRIMTFLKENGEREWSTTQLAEKLGKNKSSIRSSLRYLYIEKYISFYKIVDKREQFFKPTEKLLEWEGDING